MTTHTNILAWEIPRTEEPGRLQFMGLQRVGHDWVTKQQGFLSQQTSSFKLEKQCCFRCDVVLPFHSFTNQKYVPFPKGRGCASLITK